MANEPRFRKPGEMQKDEKREPLSTRLKSSTKKILEREADKAGIPLAMLVSNVLDDYVEWLAGKGKQ